MCTQTMAGLHWSRNVGRGLNAHLANERAYSRQPGVKQALMDCHIKQITVLNADCKPAHSSVDTGSPLPIWLDECGEQGEVTNR